MSTSARSVSAGWVGRVFLAPAIWVERARGRKRLAILALYALVLGAAACWAYRASRLSGLPDIGDPFDVPAFTDAQVLEGQDAFLVYQRAISKLKRLADQLPVKIPEQWRDADEAVRSWVTNHREAMALWHEGTECSQMPYKGFEGAVVLECNYMEQFGGPNPSMAFGYFAMLEASRLADAGDLAGAADWYLALLRFSRHVQTRALETGRGQGLRLHEMARRGLERWASDPRVDTALLQKVFKQVLATEATSAPVSDTLKAQYLYLTNELDRPDRYRQMIGQKSNPAEPDWLVQIEPVVWLRWYVGNEEERCRRLARLLFANWLAECDKPWDIRPVFTTEWHIYVDPEAPPAAQALPPEKLAQFLEESRAATSQYLMWPYLEHLMGADRADQAELIICMGERLHFRLHGYVPTSPESLVGRVLTALPQGFDPLLQPRPGPRPRLKLEPRKGLVSPILLEQSARMDGLFASGKRGTELRP